MTDRWHGTSYQRLSDPQFSWGVRVLDRLKLAGDETVLDAGCGTGRLTELLLERLPRGRVIAVDRSPSMLEVARERLSPRFGERITLIEADLQTFVAAVAVDAIFSTATFHWVSDHALLFRNLFASLRPGGRLVAQCGGGPNIARLHDRAARLMNSSRYTQYFTQWRQPWVFHDPESTAQRLREAGFVEIETGLQEQPTPFNDAQTFREFIESVVLHEHLAALPESERTEFLDALVTQALADDPPLVLDYWRLNMKAQRPE